jgi:lipid-binding SYLF domain-containing protein
MMKFTLKDMMMKKIKYVLVCFLVVMIASPAFADKYEDRKEIQEMRSKTLERLYKEEPDAKATIANSVGYAVFSSGGVNLLFVSAAYGSGVARDKKTGKDIYMEMASGGVGLGLGVKDYRLVFAFSDRKAFDRFLEHGWDFSGQADAAAKAGNDGVELSEAVDPIPGVKIYQLTESGLALQITLQGTKYWKDDDLNH